jgi:hypothetical protein
MFFSRVDPMILADTKHGTVMRLTGIHSVTGLTPAGMTQSDRASGLTDCIFLRSLFVKLLREQNIKFETAIGQMADPA